MPRLQRCSKVSPATLVPILDALHGTAISHLTFELHFLLRGCTTSHYPVPNFPVPTSLPFSVVGKVLHSLSSQGARGPDGRRQRNRGRPRNTATIPEPIGEINKSKRHDNQC